MGGGTLAAGITVFFFVAPKTDVLYKSAVLKRNML